MKKQRRYRPKGLSKEEKRYINAMLKREIVMLVIVLAAAIAVLIAIIQLTKAAGI